jgi:hypothetical protein
MPEDSSNKTRSKSKDSEFFFNEAGEQIPANALDQAIGEAAEEENIEGAAPNSDLLTLEVKSLEVEGLRVKLNRSENLHSFRKLYIGRLFWLTVLWLVVVIVFVGFAGSHFLGFTLSDKVIIAFITSTTVSVIGLFHFAAKWLFPSSSADQGDG